MAGSLVPLGLAVALLAALAPGDVAAQANEVVSKQIAVGQNEASLRLELQDDRSLDITFRDGIVTIDGEEAGSFQKGGELDGAWRELLGRAVALDDGPLARTLVDWQPPSDLEGDALGLASRIDGTLESAFATGAAAPSAGVDLSIDNDKVIRSLLDRTDQLAELGKAMEGLRLGNIQVRVGEDVRVERDTEMEGTLVALDSDVQVDGTVDGDVVVVGGTLRVGDEGRITGDVRLADARLLQRDGTIDGSVTQVSSDAVRPDTEARDRLREELRREMRDEMRTATARSHEESDGGWSVLRPLRAIGHGFAGVLRTLINILVLGLLGWGVVFFSRENLAVVAETARRSPARSAMVGMAGAFMILPVWVLGALALVLTVVGIFALPFWLLLFPLAVAAAALLGFFAAASGVGEWLAPRRYPFLDWVRSSNPYTLVAGGVIALMAPFLLAHVVEMAVFLGFLEGLLTVVGWMIILVAACVGFGAVLITRAGRRPDYYPGDFFDDDEDWEGDSGSPTPGPSGGDWFGGDSAPGTEAPTDAAPEAEPTDGTPETSAGQADEVAGDAGGAEASENEEEGEHPGG